MLSQAKHAQKQWGGTHSAVDTWLAERQQVLVEFYHIAGLTSQKNNAQTSMPSMAQLTSFCQILMDYVSAGHFEIFDILSAGDVQAESLKQQLYPKLLATTDTCLTFNDRFSSLQDEELAKGINLSIEGLGKTLAERFELEDKMLEHLFSTPS